MASIYVPSASFDACNVTGVISGAAGGTTEP